jgi:hypothetical protein
MKSCALTASRNPGALWIRPLAFLAIGALMLLTGRSMSAATPAPQAAPPKSLIYAGWYGWTTPTPSFIAQNLAFLETQPFNGLAVYMRNPSMSINATTAIMTSNPISYEDISSVLAPMAGVNYTQLKENFGVVMGSTPPDFFDSWSTTIQNFANLAAALRDAGFKGIIFDNEQYFSPWANYPEGMAYPGTSLAQYEVQAALRGRQVMEAMVAQFPEIVVVTLHGPYVSEPNAPWEYMFPQWWPANELLGPFFAGFQEGTITSGQNVDGGELYDLRSSTEFQNSYNWRRYDLPSDAVDCSFISPSVRTTWPDDVSISYGVYDCPFLGRPMSPSVLTPTLVNALATADRWVWFYAESYTYLLPSDQGGAPADWVAAVRAALPVVVDEPEPDPVPPPPPPLVPPTAQATGDDGHKSRCGLLGIEVAPLFLALAFLRARRRK